MIDPRGVLHNLRGVRCLHIDILSHYKLLLHPRLRRNHPSIHSRITTSRTISRIKKRMQINEQRRREDTFYKSHASSHWVKGQPSISRVQNLGVVQPIKSPLHHGSVAQRAKGSAGLQDFLIHYKCRPESALSAVSVKETGSEPTGKSIDRTEYGLIFSVEMLFIGNPALHHSPTHQHWHTWARATV